MLAKKRLLAIINPISGTRSKLDKEAIIREVLSDERFDISIAYTQYGGHATEIARQASAEGFDYVLAVGGDGTCNEVAKSLIHTNTALGIVPIGSGNGLARHIGIAMDIRRALRTIAQENILEVDYCKANNIPFFCTCGVGFDALVSDRFAGNKTRGKMTYLRNIVIEFQKYNPATYYIQNREGLYRQKAFMIACGNASQYGNNAYITPQATMTDGLIDVTIIKPFSLMDIAPLTFLLFTKMIDKNKNVVSFQEKEVVIQRDAPGIMHIDGEPVMMEAEIEVQCIKGGLKVLVPKPQKGLHIIEPISDLLLDVVDNIRYDIQKLR